MPIHLQEFYQQLNRIKRESKVNKLEYPIYKKYSDAAVKSTIDWQKF